jgi:hypothetical protein
MARLSTALLFTTRPGGKRGQGARVVLGRDWAPGITPMGRRKWVGIPEGTGLSVGVPVGRAAPARRVGRGSSLAALPAAARASKTEGAHPPRISGARQPRTKRALPAAVEAHPVPAGAPRRAEVCSRGGAGQRRRRGGRSAAARALGAWGRGVAARAPRGEIRPPVAALPSPPAPPLPVVSPEIGAPPPPVLPPAWARLAPPCIWCGGCAG